MTYCPLDSHVNKMTEQYTGPNGEKVSKETMLIAIRHEAMKHGDNPAASTDEGVFRYLDDMMNPQSKRKVNYQYAQMREAITNDPGFGRHNAREIAESIEENFGTQVLSEMGVSRYTDNNGDIQYVWHEPQFETAEELTQRLNDTQQARAEMTGESLIEDLKKWSQASVKRHPVTRKYMLNGNQATATMSNAGVEVENKSSSPTIHTMYGNVVDMAVREMAKAFTNGEELLDYDEFIELHKEESTKRKKATDYANMERKMLTEDGYNQIQREFQNMVEYYDKVFNGRKWKLLGDEVPLATAVPILENGKLRFKTVSGTPDLIAYSTEGEPEIHIIDIKTSMNGYDPKNLNKWSSQTSYYAGVISSVSPALGKAVKGTGVMLINTKRESLSEGGEIVGIRLDGDSGRVITNDGDVKIELMRDSEGFKAITTSARFNHKDLSKKDVHIEKAQRVMTISEKRDVAKSLASYISYELGSINKWLSENPREELKEDIIDYAEEIGLEEEDLRNELYFIDSMYDIKASGGDVKSFAKKNLPAFARYVFLQFMDTYEYTRSIAARHVYDNIHHYISMASSYYKLVEGIGIGVNSEYHVFDGTEQSILEEVDLDEGVEEDEIQVEKMFGVSYKTMKQINSMPAQLKRAFSFIGNGRVEDGINPLGNIHNAGDIFVILRSHLSSADTYQEMIDRLNKIKDDIPWAENIVGIIDENKEKFSDIEHENLKSLFFNQMKRSQSTYTGVDISNGQVKVSNRNRDQAVQRIILEFKRQVNSGKGGLFYTTDTSKGYKSALVRKTGIIELDNIFDGLGKDLNRMRDGSDIHRQAVIDKLYKAISRIGLSYYSKEDIAFIVNNTDPKRISNIFGFIGDIKRRAAERLAYGKPTNIFKGETIDGKYKLGIYGNLIELIGALDEILPDKTERMVRDNGKDYQGYTLLSYATQLTERLSNKAKGNNRLSHVQEFMKERFQTFTYGKMDDNGNFVYHNDLLDKISKGRLTMKHHQQLSFNDIEYTGQSQSIYVSSMIAEFYGNDFTKQVKENDEAYYPIPVLSDKPAYEFITGVHYGSLEEIHGVMKNFIDYEIRRNQMLWRQYESGSGPKIKNFNFDKIGKDIQEIKDKSNKPNFSYANELIGLLGTNGFDIHFMPDMKKNLQELIANGEGNFAERIARDLFTAMFNGAHVSISKEDIGKLYKMSVNREVKRLMDMGVLDYRFYGRSHDGEISGFSGIDLKEAAFLYDFKDERELYERIMEEYRMTGDEELKIEGRKALERALDEFRQIKIQDYVEQYIVNQANIINMLVGDPMFYKDPIDMQKRMGQVHSPYMPMNTEANIYYKNRDGNMVPARASDGKHRVIYIKDNVLGHSSMLDSVDRVLGRLIDKASTPELKAKYKKRLESVKESIKNAETSDGQAFSSPSAMRKKLVMAGMWSDAKQEAFEKVMRGEPLSAKDIDIITQPTKPFSYSTEVVRIGENDVTVGVQLKDSEYMLSATLLAWSGIQMEPRLKKLMDYVESTHYDANGVPRPDGIDTVVFSSGVKTGLHSDISLDEFKDENMSMDDVRQFFEDNKESVHNLWFRDYGYQQTVSDHYVDNKQLDGSQMRVLDYAGIDPNDIIDFFVNGRRGTVAEARQRYNKAYSELITESVNEFLKEIVPDRLQNESTLEYKFRRNNIMSNIVMQHMMTQSKFDPDILFAFQLNDDGEFNIPISEGINSIKVQQFLYSIIRDRVFKQKVAGGSLVQATSDMLSDELSVKMKVNERGEEVFDYFEAAMPVPNAELEKLLRKPDGTLMQPDEAITKGIITQNMIESLVYRIPTENKYSIAPIRIVKFLPRAAGNTVMLPREIVAIAGSDFDIDKLYIKMKKLSKNSVPFKNLSPQEKAGIVDYIVNELKLAGINSHQTDVRDILEGKADSKTHREYRRVIELENSLRKSNMEYDNSRRAQLEREIVDLQIAAMRTKSSTESMFLLGNFDQQKIAGYKAWLIENTDIPLYAESKGQSKEKAIDEMNLDELEKAYNSHQYRPLMLPSSNAYFKDQNSSGQDMVGISANSNVAHAVMQHLGIKMNFHGDLDGLTVGDLKLGKETPLDSLYALDRVSKILDNTSTFVMASTDTAKVPSLSLMGINKTSSKFANLFIRLGMDVETVGMILANPSVREAIRRYDEGRATGYGRPLKDVFYDIIRENNMHIPGEVMVNNPIKNATITKDELIRSIRTKNIKKDGQVAYKLLLMLSELNYYADELNKATFIAKYNSQNNAPGPSMVQAESKVEKVYNFAELEMTRDKDKRVFSDDIFKLIPESVFKDLQEQGKGIHLAIPKGERAYIPNAFYENAIGDDRLERALFGDSFIYKSKGYKKVKSLIKSMAGIELKEKALEKIANDLTLYLLTGDHGDVGKAVDLSPDRVKYLTSMKYADSDGNIADGFIGTILDLKDRDTSGNALLNAIYVDDNNTDNLQHLRVDFREIDDDGRQALSDAWYDMFRDEKTHQVAKDLFAHFLLMGGTAFNPKSIMHLMPNQMKMEMAEYIAVSRNISALASNMSESKVNEFVEQFFRNNAWDNGVVYSVSKRAKSLMSITKYADGSIQIKPKERGNTIALNPFKTRSYGRTSYREFVSIDGELYRYEPTSIAREDDQGVRYLKVDTLGSKNTYKEYMYDAPYGFKTSLSKGDKSLSEDFDERMSETKRVYADMFATYEGAKDFYDENPYALVNYVADRVKRDGKYADALGKYAMKVKDTIDVANGDSIIDALSEELSVLIQGFDSLSVYERIKEFC